MHSRKKQTCESVVANRKDQDCDGRLDAPDGMNLLEYGQVCGVEYGERALQERWAAATTPRPIRFDRYGLRGVTGF